MVLSGRVERRNFGEGEALYIGATPLAEALEEFNKERVYCCWAFDSTRPVDMDHLRHVAILSAEGLVDARLYGSYSEITGFLWMNEDAKVGGHDLLALFEAHAGEFAALVIQREPIDLTLL